MWIRLSLGVVLLVLSAFLYISSDNASRLELTYKSHKISITRDQYGIPKVSSRDFEGVLFGLGYTLSKDRLFQIHTRRMVASGRLSEMFGNRTLQTDIMFR
jgi:penicillin amidase